MDNWKNVVKPNAINNCQYYQLGMVKPTIQGVFGDGLLLGSEPHSNRQRTTGIDPHARNGHVEKIVMDLQTLTTNHYAINIQANQGNQQIKDLVKFYSD